MERESTKHGPRIDEELAHETESMVRGAPVEARSRGERIKETPDAGEGAHADGRRPDVPSASALGEEELDARSEMARHLAGLDFPAERERLLEAAVRQDAPDDVIARLAMLPERVPYATVAQVWEATGGHREGGHTD